jgi:hypothetical protein
MTSIAARASIKDWIVGKDTLLQIDRDIELLKVELL